MASTVAQQLPAELEAIAAAAGQRLRAQTTEDEEQASVAQQTLIAAASTAIAAGASLSAVAAAEQTGQARVRDELGKELLRAIERTARRRREIDLEYQDAIRRAGRLGIAHRDIAAAASAAPGTIRSLLARQLNATHPPTSPDPQADNEHGDHDHADNEPGGY